MATSMVFAGKCLRNINTNFLKTFCRKNYIVLLPEVPSDTAEENPLLDAENLPKFSEITPSNYYYGVGKAMLMFEMGIHTFETTVQDPSCKKTFDNVMKPIESSLNLLDYTWATLKNQVVTNHSNELAKVHLSLESRVMTSKIKRFQSKPIYHAFKEINADRSLLTLPQQRIVDKYLLEARLGGVELSGNNLEHFKNIHSTLHREKTMYRLKVDEATYQFSHKINDFEIVRDFPPELIHALASAKSLRKDVYDMFMQHCPDRDLRWNTWNAYNTRCSLDNKELSNSLHIEEIRFQRANEAKLIGYHSFVDLSMETKMAGSVENVKAMLASLHAKAKPAMEQELNSLETFARDRGFDYAMELWDVPYWRRKQNYTLHRVDDDEVRTYFPCEKVLSGLFEFCSNLFGINIEEATTGVDVWHDSVRLFNVYENGEYKASFYLDLFARPQKKMIGSAMDVARNRCDSVGVKPLAYVTADFNPPILNQPALLSYENVESLFKQFGKALQHLLTEVPYTEAAGLTNIEWDAVDVCSNFMCAWLQDYSVIKMISSHYQDGQPLPYDLFDKICKGKMHMASYDLMQEMYLSDLDLNLYSSKEFWLDITRKLWPEYNSLTLQKEDCHPCSMPMIFSYEYAAAYYCFLWSEMIAADIYEAFNEVKNEDPQVMQQTGQRFRDSFLALGGGCHSSEIFRMFRGRDPSPDALLKKYKLLKVKEESDESVR